MGQKGLGELKGSWGAGGGEVGDRSKFPTGALPTKTILIYFPKYPKSPKARKFAKDVKIFKTCQNKPKMQKLPRQAVTSLCSGTVVC
jgi:hypothetical protein